MALWLTGVATWIGIGPPQDTASQADVAIVLGAAVHAGEPSPVFRERINHALALYQDGRVQRLVFTGGSNATHVSTEAMAGAVYAWEAGIPIADIHFEGWSKTTRENLIGAQEVMADAGQNSALIVSDPLHLRRAMAMADQLGMDAQPSATPTTRYQSLSTQLPFLLRETYFIHHFWIFGD